MPVKKQIQYGRYHLGDWIAQRYSVSAIPTSPAKNQIRQNRDIEMPRDYLTTTGAKGTRFSERLLAGQSMDDHVQETAHG